MISNVRYAQEFNATFHGMFKSLHLDKVQEWKWEKICESCSILSVVLQDPYHCKILDYFDHKNPMLRCQLVISPSEKEVIFIKSLNLFWQLEINWSECIEKYTQREEFDFWRENSNISLSFTFFSGKIQTSKLAR